MKYALICLTLILLFLPVNSSASERAEVLEKSRLNFGEPVDLSQNLYEVNGFYVFQLIFDAKDRVEELKVVPKYYYELSHPEWKETDDFKPLAFTAYNRLLEKLDGIKPKGKLLKKAKIGISGNATTFYDDKYQMAVLETGYIFSFDDDINLPAEIRYLRLDFSKDRNKGIYNPKKKFKFKIS